MQRFLKKYHTIGEDELHDSVENINMERLHRDLRRALDFESMEVDSNNNDLD